MSKAVEKRMWPFEHPLAQFELSSEVLYNLQRWADELSVAEIASQSAAELGQLIHMNERQGAALSKAATHFPTVNLTHHLRPLTSDLLKIAIKVSKDFNWNSRLHGEAEPFWLWVEDHEGTEIIQWSHLLLRQNTVDMEVDFVIPIRGSQPPPSVSIRFMSDRWMGAEDEVKISLEELIMPSFSDCHTPLLDLPFLPVTGNLVSSPFYKLHFRDFSGIQTQCFWSLTQTYQNILVCAPAGSGKSTLAMLALWYVILTPPLSIYSCCVTSHAVGTCGSDGFGMVVVPNRSSAKETASLFRFSQGPARIAIETILLPDALLAKRGKGIRITTASCLLAALRSDVGQSWISDLKIVLCDNLELLDADYELAVSLLVSQTQQLPVRFVGVSNCLNDPMDLARWLHVPHQGLFSFRPSDREQSLTTKTISFTIRHSSAFFEAMTKPAHAAISEAAADASALLFVPSRSQCHTVAANLITQCAIDIDTRAFLGRGASAEDVEVYLRRLHNSALSDLISHGIGVFHEGMHRADLTLMLQLYLEGIIRVLIVPREACWTVPVRASVVIVMGAEYLSHVSEADRQLRAYSIREVAKMQACAVRPGQSGVFHLFCQAEQRDTFTRFLDEGLPLESTLVDSGMLKNWLQDMRKRGTIASKQDFVEALSFTYFARRLETNPLYYDGSPGKKEHDISRHVDRLWES
jgi:antiviral helicase SLH1